VALDWLWEVLVCDGKTDEKEIEIVVNQLD